MFLQDKYTPCFKKNLPKIRELSDFNEIFSVDLSMDEFYNASVILFQNFLIFFRSLTLEAPLLGGGGRPLKKNSTNTFLEKKLF